MVDKSRLYNLDSRSAILTTDKETDVSWNIFMIWKINSGLWAVVWAGLWNKRVLADYEQLLRPFFSLFRGQKIKKKFFWKLYSVRTEKLHNNFIKKIWIFFFFESEKGKKTVFFRAKIWVEFECKYIKVGTRHLFSYLCQKLWWKEEIVH